MSTSCGLLSADWGNVADWLNVVVAIAGAAAVFYLGWQANKLGHAANDIAGQAAREAKEVEQREGRLLLLSLYPTLHAIWGAALSTQIYLTQDRGKKEYWVKSQDIRAESYRRASQLKADALLEELDRLHKIGSEADVLVRLHTECTRVRNALKTGQMVTGPEPILDGMHDRLVIDLQKIINNLGTIQQRIKSENWPELGLGF